MRGIMRFLQILALLICGTDSSDSKIPGDAIGRIAHFLGPSPSDSALRKTNTKIQVIVDKARASVGADAMLQDIHRDYKGLIEHTNITAEDILGLFVWSPKTMHKITPCLYREDVLIPDRPLILWRGSLADDSGTICGRYLSINTVNALTGPHPVSTMLFFFEANGELF